MSNIPETLTGENKKRFTRTLPLPVWYEDEIKTVLKGRILTGLEKTIAIAVDNLKRPKGFGGPYPTGNSIGFTQIEPFHWGGSAYSYRVNMTSTGWQSLSTIDGKTIRDDTWLFLYALWDPEPSRIVDALEFQVSTRNFPVLRFKDIIMSENGIVPLPEPIILLPKNEVTAKVHVTATGYTQLQFLGYAVTHGNNTTKRSYYS